MQAIRKKEKRKNADFLAFPVHLSWFVGPGIGLAVGLLIGVVGTLRWTMESNSISPVQSVCVTTDNAPELGTASDATGYGQAIEAYLSAGGNPVQLRQLLLERGMLPEPDPRFPIVQTAGVYHYDLTGDATKDVVVNIFYPDTQNPRTYAIWVYVCDGATYGQVGEHLMDVYSPVMLPGMYVRDIRDLNNDMRPELLYTWGECAVTTCWLAVNVETWDGTLGTMRNVLETHFPRGEYWLRDTDGDGTIEVVMARGVLGSVGAGPQREHVVTYGWDGTQFVVRSDIPTPPTFRFQAAEDAITALVAGDLQTAEALYRRALSDSTLNGLGSPYDEVLATRALFGVLVTTAAQNGIEAANTAYALLQATPLIPYPNPSSSTESLWVAAGRVFYEVAQEAGDLSAACDAVIAELEAKLDDVENYLLYSGTFGYGNSSPLPEEACPF